MHPAKGADPGELEKSAPDAGAGGIHHLTAQHRHIGADQRGKGSGHHQLDSPVCHWLHPHKLRSPHPPGGEQAKKAHKFTAIEQKWIGRMEKYLIQALAEEGRAWVTMDAASWIVNMTCCVVFGHSLQRFSDQIVLPDYCSTFKTGTELYIFVRDTLRNRAQTVHFCYLYI